MSIRRPVPAAARATRVPLGAMLAGLAASVWLLAAPSWGQDTIVTHGYSTFGDLKYPADFPHLDYVNPEAPKGGEIRIAAEGTFDSFNAYSTLRGTPAALSTIMYERILTGTSDEVSANYCLLCTTMEYPPSEDWVIFHLRPEARFFRRYAGDRRRHRVLAQAAAGAGHAVLCELRQGRDCRRGGA
jgi:microcin C transport system substrate-binding protein